MAGNAVESGRTVTSKVTSILMVFADGSESLSELARITHIPLHRLGDLVGKGSGTLGSALQSTLRSVS
jgi:hypothetical protein